jgi:hypothetical protein
VLTVLALGLSNAALAGQLVVSLTIRISEKRCELGGKP